MTEIVFIAFGLFLGGLVAWIWATARARSSSAKQLEESQARARAVEHLRDELHQQLDRRNNELTELRARLEKENQSAKEVQTRLEAAQKKFLEETTSELADRFKSLSSEALRSNNQSFLELAKQALGAILDEAKGDVSARQEAVDALIKPLQDTLKRYEEQTTALEESRQKTYGSLEGHLRSLETAQQQLHRETTNLVTALRTPRVRGRWGEITLRRVVELAGMSERCDYVEQLSMGSEDGRQRPDLIVHLPAGREIIVDAKVSLDGYLDALSASTEEERNLAMGRYAQQLRTHMNQLASKTYRGQLPKAPELVVMFVPGESFFAAAVDFDRSLIEDGMGKGVLLATPITLIALLRAVAYGWRQEQIAENAKAIGELGKQLYERLRAMSGYFEEVGKSLDKAVTAYNRTVGAMESQVFAAARRFKELGASAKQEIMVIGSIDQAPRATSVVNVKGHKAKAKK